jgi:hypothetical protein
MRAVFLEHLQLFMIYHPSSGMSFAAILIQNFAA